MSLYAALTGATGVSTGAAVMHRVKTSQVFTEASTETLEINSASTDANAALALKAQGGMDVDVTLLTVDASTGGISLNAGAASNLSTSAGDLSLSAVGALVASSSEATIDAVHISAADAAGGITIDAGTAGINLDTTGGISLGAAAASSLTTSSGDLTLDAAATLVLGGSTAINLLSAAISLGATGALSLDAGAASNLSTSAGDLTLSAVGSLVASSSEATADAVHISAAHAAGGIAVDAGTAGIGVNTTGGIAFGAAAASTLTTSDGALSLAATASGAGVTIAAGSAGDGAITLSGTIAAGSSIAVFGDTTVADLHIGGAFEMMGDMVVNGNLRVTGTRTEIRTQTLLVEDNITILNEPPVISTPVVVADAGQMVTRFPGHIVAEGTPEYTAQVVSEHTNSSDPALASAAVAISSSADQVVNYFKGWIVNFKNGSTFSEKWAIVIKSTVNTSGDSVTLTFAGHSAGIDFDLFDAGTPPTSADVFMHQYIGAVYAEAGVNDAVKSKATTLEFLGANLLARSKTPGDATTINVTDYVDTKMRAVVLDAGAALADTASSNLLYFGAPSTADGQWRFAHTADNALQLERFEAGDWVIKSAWQ
jgi:hypothetical protein